MLLELLRLRDAGPQDCQNRPPFDPDWESDMFHFFCHMFYRERAFEDMCAAAPLPHSALPPPRGFMVELLSSARAERWAESRTS